MRPFEFYWPVGINQNFMTFNSDLKKQNFYVLSFAISF